MLDIFTRANANLPLSPAARAFLRLLEGLLATALVAALPIVADALAGTSIDWRTVLRTAIAAAAVAVLLALSKYAKAHGDPMVGAVVAQAATTEAANLTRQYGLSDTGNRPADLLNVAVADAPAPSMAPAPDVTLEALKGL